MYTYRYSILCIDSIQIYTYIYSILCIDSMFKNIHVNIHCIFVKELYICIHKNIYVNIHCICTKELFLQTQGKFSSDAPRICITVIKKNKIKKM